MNLISVNLSPSSAINIAVYGNFSGPKNQEIVVAKNNYLELLRPDDNGKVITISSTPVFSVIRSLITVRLAGANRDYIVIGSDAGKVSIAEFDNTLNSWKVLHCETFGKTGCRRIVPGQYLAADPKGRAILIGAVEKQKLVYVLNRDSNNKLTISSPLEAHKSETIVFSVCGVDAGFDNPIFAMIELEYSEADQDPTGAAVQEAEKKLSYYELDLGLNHVVRKWSEPISRTANFLLSVPGGEEWPSGVLICGENWVSYKHQGHPEIRAPIPRRFNLPTERGVLITSGALHKQKDMFFFLLQSEYGDLYKVTLEIDPNDRKIITNVFVSVFDTIQLANSLCITKTGLLYTASEFSNHKLFQFQGIDDANAIRGEKVADSELNEELGDDSESAARVAPVFQASNKLQNLLIVDDIPSLAPITDMMIDDLYDEESKQIYALCGRNNHSSLRVLRHGISVNELAVSELIGRATAVWTLKTSHDEEFDRYIIVSLNTSTVVLAAGETIVEVTDSGFLTNCSTLQVALLADGAMLQVYHNGIRHIRPDSRPTEWKPPGRRSIQLASVNARQVAISLSGGEIIYFELDEAGQLTEIGTTDMGVEITCLDVGVIPEGKIRSPFLAVGNWNDTYQILSLDPSDMLGKGPPQSTNSRPTSVAFIEMSREISYDEKSANNGTLMKDIGRSLYLNIGTEKGVLIRVAVDAVTGDLSDSRMKFLGPKSIKLYRMMIHNIPCMMALTTQAWLLYNYQNKYHQDPLSYEMLEHVCNFTSEAVLDGIVAVTGNTLRILTIDNLGELFNQQVVALRYTPRKIIRIPNTKQLVIIETDHQEFTEEEKQQLIHSATYPQPPPSSSSAAASRMDEDGNGEEEEEEDLEGKLITVRELIPLQEAGKWASGIRILECTPGNANHIPQTKAFVELSHNEAIFSVCTCRFIQFSEETFLLVGTAQDLILQQKKFTMCYIHVYRILDDGNNLQLLHKTEVEDIPYSMIELQGKLLVGVGRSLRLYDMGKKKLLKKTENKTFPHHIMKLMVIDDRIFVGDVSQSMLFVKYHRQENVFHVFADDTLPRFITSMCVVDYNTVACGDKFGNIFTLRLPDTVNEDHSFRLHGGGTQSGGMNTNLWEHGLLNGAPNKLELVTHYYLGEIPTSISKSSLKYHGKEVLIVSTITGGLYAFVPHHSKEDHQFFLHLEMFMRKEYTNLTQRDHLSYRSLYQPVKNTIDMSLCERFMSLPYAKQKDFGDTVDRTPTEVVKKLEDISNFL